MPQPSSRSFVLHALAIAIALPVHAQSYDPVELCVAGGPAGLAAGDLNGDGRLDLIVVSGRHAAEVDHVWLHPAYEDFVIQPLDLPDGRTRSYAIDLGDVDGDGDLDAVRATDRGDPKSILLNDGHGRFSRGALLEPSNDLPSYAAAARHSLFADLDLDGDLDVVLTTRVTGIYAFENVDGGRRFVAHEVGPPFRRDSTGVVRRSLEASRAVVADFDADGFPDIAVAARGGSSVFLGSGGFDYDRALIGLDGIEFVEVATGDLNGDGAIDLVYGSVGNGLFIYRNPGTGGFERPERLGHPRSTARGVELVDIDGDSDIDIVVGNEKRGFVPGESGMKWSSPVLDTPNRIYLNDGHGRFSEGPVFGSSGQATREVLVADFNGDGIPDIVEANDCGSAEMHIGR